MGLWVDRQGGVITAADGRQHRLETVAARLTGARPELRIAVHVLASDAVTAYSWPNRNVFVTRGLMDVATDDELSAAIAHELGHLLGRRPVQEVALGLRGCDRNLAAEARADAIGCQILEMQGDSSTAMVSLLERIRSSGNLPPACQGAVARRIALLRNQS